MTAHFRGWLVPIAVAVAIVTVFVLQQRIAVRLRVDIEAARRVGRESSVAADNAQLRRTLPSDADIERLRSDHEALGRLNAELDALRGSLREPRAVSEQAVFRKAATEWQNVGYETPQRALETALWAARSGDLELFSRSLVLEPLRQDGTGNQIPEWLRPPAEVIRRRVVERTLENIPLGHVNAMVGRSDDVDSVRMDVSLSGRNSKTGEATSRGAKITFRRQPDGWRLVVPADVVERYGAEPRQAPER